jgi:predicted RNA-binding Zn ribbon-like protein
MKTLVTNYSFDKTAKTVTLTDYTTINQAGLLLITNTTDGQIIYNFADPTAGATVAGNVITLEYDTTSMDNGDALQIYYDDPAIALATESAQAEASQLLTAVYEAVEVLTMLSNMRDTLNQLRVGIVSGSVGIAANQTLATLTTLSNLAAVGGFSAQQQIPAAQNTAAIQSNINNVVIS